MSQVHNLLFALLVGVVAVAHASRNIYWGLQSTRWPEVEGEVTKSFPRGWYGSNYRPVVRYSYRRGDRAYRGSRILFGYLQIPSKASALVFLSQYQPGERIAIRVHPRRPGLSVLRPGNRFLNWVELGGGVLVLVCFVPKLWSVVLR